MARAKESTVEGLVGGRDDEIEGCRLVGILCDGLGYTEGKSEDEGHG